MINSFEIQEEEQDKDENEKYRCQNCENNAEWMCSRCESIYYCGNQCQKEDWVTSHKRKCYDIFLSGYLLNSTTHKKFRVIPFIELMKDLNNFNKKEIEEMIKKIERKKKDISSEDFQEDHFKYLPNKKKYNHLKKEKIKVWDNTWYNTWFLRKSNRKNTAIISFPHTVNLMNQIILSISKKYIRYIKKSQIFRTNKRNLIPKKKEQKKLINAFKDVGNLVEKFSLLIGDIKKDKSEKIPHKSDLKKLLKFSFDNKLMTLKKTNEKLILKDFNNKIKIKKI